MKIYFRSKRQLEQLKRKYKNYLDRVTFVYIGNSSFAEDYKKLKGQFDKKLTPLICTETDTDKDRCVIGGDYIEKVYELEETVEEFKQERMEKIMEEEGEEE